MKISLCHLLLLLCQSDAFTPSTPRPLFATSLSVTTSVENDIFFRAVECAQGADASAGELDKLARDLENVEGCKYEEGKEACDKEIQDRMDVAQTLRLRIELQLRTDYLKTQNLFASDVLKSHDVEKRKQFKQALLENRAKNSDGHDLGLW